MSVRYFEILRDSCHKGNYIPSGRQLPRTPPLTDVKRHLDFSNDDSYVGCEEPQQNTEEASSDQDDHDKMFDFSTHETKTEPDEPSSMLKGMKGYQLTAGDLEFIKRMKEEKLVKKYQGDLEDVQRLLKKETMALELSCALRDKAEAELNKFPSSEDVTEWVKVVLTMTSSSGDLTDLDTKSLLAMVTKENIQTAMNKKKIQLARMEKMMANKRKKEAEERGRREKEIANEQLKIQGLMSQLSDLTSELAQQDEIYKVLQMQLKSQEEIKVDAEKVDDSEAEAAKSQVKSRGKEIKKATEKSQNASDKSNKVKSKRSKRTDSKTDGGNTAKDDHVNKSTSEMLTSTAEQTKQKSEAPTEKPTKTVKASRGPQKKVKEQESNSQDPLQTVSRRRNPPGATRTVASQSKNQHKVKTGEAQSTSQQAAPSRTRKKTAVAAGDAVEEEAPNAGLRRSRRIASRR
ncbi:axoneme-associated protein mst101(2)-like [Anabas testudineus]|uniref:Uncharacterized protein n=1 Tax=Anabas testudineus TaxID=64144 RepID=A0A7N6BQE1_ANATE|nr:axoneme-associated protein mst101(2)-like [Anabas testudineus]